MIPLRFRLVLGLAALPAPVAAQGLRILVRESGPGGRPSAGALVTLVDPGGRATAAAIANDLGLVRFAGAAACGWSDRDSATRR